MLRTYFTASCSVKCHVLVIEVIYDRTEQKFISTLSIHSSWS